MHLYIDRDNLNKQLDNAAHLTNPEGCTAAGERGLLQWVK